MNLKVQKVDPYQFVNKNFTIAVVLPDNFPDISRRTSNLPLKVDVCFDEEVSQFDHLDRNYNPNLVDVVSNTNIDRSRRAVVTLRLKEPSASHNNKKFVIRFMALTLEGESNSICGYSIPITVVRFKLKIQEEFADHGSYIWMKDVGGKDKSIDLQVGVVDTNDTYVMNRRVPLRVALLYASGVSVPQQDILQLSPDSQLLIGQGGFTRIKCRINEVSSRHQGQLFQILVSPDYDLPSPLADISPARSVPVEVKSKINFSHKRKMQALGETSPGGTASGAASSTMGSSSYHNGGSSDDPTSLEDSKLGILRSAYPNYDAFRARNFDNFTTPSALPVSSVPINLSVAQLIKPSPFGGAVPIQTNLSHTPSLHTPHPSSILPLSSVLSSSRSEGVASGTNTSTLTGSASGASNPLPGGEERDLSLPAQGSALTANLTAFAKRKSNDALNEMYHRAFHRGGAIAPNGDSLLPVTPIETGVWGRSSIQAAEALKDLTSWVELVYSSLREMQWTPLGQLQGAMNPETGLAITHEERLMYNMRNPNKLIEGLALGYQERVLAHLTTLDSFITLRALTPKNNQAHLIAQGQLPHDPYAVTSGGGGSGTASVASSGARDPLLHAASGDFWDTFHSQASPRAASSASRSAAAAAATAVTAAAAHRVTPALHATASALPHDQTISPLPHGQLGPPSHHSNHSGARAQDLFEQSSVRLVFLEKVVYAVVGPERAETLLGVAAFGSAEGKQRFIGFYSQAGDGSIGFQSHAELLSLLHLHPSTALSQPVVSTSNTTSTTTTTATATATVSAAASSLEHAACLPVVCSPSHDPTSTSTTSTSTTNSATNHASAHTDPVQQLLRQISAAELCSSLSVVRDPLSNNFDLSLLQRHWPSETDTPRIYIQVE